MCGGSMPGLPSDGEATRWSCGLRRGQSGARVKIKNRREKRSSGYKSFPARRYSLSRGKERKKKSTGKASSSSRSPNRLPPDSDSDIRPSTSDLAQAMAWPLILAVTFLVINIALFASTFYQILILSDLEADYINMYEAASRINGLILPDFILQGVLSALLLMTGHWFMFLVSVPVTCYHVMLYIKRRHLIDVTEVFRVLGTEKKYRMVKLVYYPFSFSWLYSGSCCQFLNLLSMTKMPCIHFDKYSWRSKSAPRCKWRRTSNRIVLGVSCLISPPPLLLPRGPTSTRCVGARDTSGGPVGRFSGRRRDPTFVGPSRAPLAGPRGARTRPDHITPRSSVGPRLQPGSVFHHRRRRRRRPQGHVVIRGRAMAGPADPRQLIPSLSLLVFCAVRL
ncbi:hypothetical protein NL676_016836 [Syzygium grande]|nr:hypothetical protein NL676_016836 [Syzygium grande]